MTEPQSAASENFPIADAESPERATAGPQHAQWNLDSPDLYLNRELTWLAFNSRVLHQAEDSRAPLLERLKFLAIVGSNLDEFFMKRNLESRVEVVTPITDSRLRAELRFILDTQLADRRSAWEMQPDGSYIQRRPETGDDESGCQERLINHAGKRTRAQGKWPHSQSRQKPRSGRNLR